LPEDSNAVAWKTVQLCLIAAGRQKGLNVALKGKMLWLMAACLPPFMQVSFLLSAAFTTHFYGKTTIENN
jgi:hypothetical protein